MSDQSSQELTPTNLLRESSPMKSKELVEKLPISDLDRVDLALTLLDFKVGTTVKTLPEKNQLTSELLQELGLFFVINTHGEIYVSKTRENAKKLHDVFEVNRDIREQGRMSGYPNSAVETYAKSMEQISIPGKTEKEVVSILRDSMGEVTPETRREDFMAFLSFQLSKDNWLEEIEIVKKWAMAIKEFDPPLYERMVDWHRKQK